MALSESVKDNDIKKIIEPFALSEKSKNQASSLVRAIYKVLIEKDANLIEINPLVVSKDENKISDLIKKLEPEDLIKYGLIPEFVGRMPIVTTLEDLDEKSLVKILKEPKNSLTKQYKRLFEFESVKLEFREDALAEIAKKAISKKTGARGLRSILETILLKTMFSLPDLENVDSVTVDKSVVKGKSDPILSYTKNKSTSAA